MRPLYLLIFKRLLDVALSIVGIIFAIPLIICCSIAIKIDTPGPIFFRQTRVGRNGQPFTLLKFRSMVTEPQNCELQITVSGDPRVTRVGHWLRKTKLDEVPQLLNVIRGDMSLVGPRPEVPEYVSEYNLEQKQILNFKPGITGPASLSFIEEESMLGSQANPDSFYRKCILPRKLAIDLAYFRTANFSQDIKLLLLTLVTTLDHSSTR